MKTIKFSTDACDVTIMSPIIVTAPSKAMSFSHQLIDAKTGEKIDFGVVIVSKLTMKEQGEYDLPHVSDTVGQEIHTRIKKAMEKEGKDVAFEQRGPLRVNIDYPCLYDHNGNNLHHGVHAMVGTCTENQSWVAGTLETLTHGGSDVIQEIKIRTYQHSVKMIEVAELKRRRTYNPLSPRMGVKTSLGSIKLLGKEFMVRFSPCYMSAGCGTSFIGWMDHVDRHETQVEISRMIATAFPWIKLYDGEGIITFFDDVGSKNPRNAQPRATRTVTRHKLAKQ